MQLCAESISAKANGLRPTGAAVTALPPGWEERMDPSTLRPYYVNHANHTTTWERPVVAGGTAPASPAGLGRPLSNPPSPRMNSLAPGAAAAAVEALPPGWEERTDPSGKKYYVGMCIH